MRYQNKIKTLGISILALSFLVSGCSVRRYVVEKERPDQEIDGNQGYIFGTPVQKEREVKKRKTYVVEVELGQTLSTDKFEPITGENIVELQEGVVYEEYITEETTQAPSEVYIGTPVTEEKEAEEAASKAETYVVKEGDTLEKVAAKIYGNKNKWYKIYKANESQLKNANKIYPGQVLKLPE